MSSIRRSTMSIPRSGKSIPWKPALAGLILAAGAVGTAAVPAAVSAAPDPARAAASVQANQRIFGLGAGFAPGVALANARADAARKAVAAGYDPDTQCVTTNEDVEPPFPGNQLWIGESDLFCRGL
jgi:hypothetical protein